MYSIKKDVGDIELFVLKDGETEFGDETFIVNDSKEIQRLLRLNNRKAIETNFNAFLVRSGERNILIDAGAGNLFGPVAGNLRYALSEVGVQNDEITDIVVTHLHPDHIGGLLSEQGDPVFENAGLILTQTEYQFWKNSENFKDKLEDQTLPLSVLLKYEDKLNLISNEADIGSGLSAIDLPGHTLGHIGVMISSGSEKFVIAGDVIHAQYLQIYNPDIGVVFDQDPNLARKSRRKMLDILADEEIAFSGGHILSPAIGFIERRGNGYIWVQGEIN